MLLRTGHRYNLAAILLCLLKQQQIDGIVVQNAIIIIFCSEIFQPARI